MQFERRDFPTIMDGLVVRYLATGNADYSISASRNSVSVHYPIGWATEDEGADFMAVLTQAENHMEALRKCGEPMPFFSEPSCVVRYVKPGFAGNPDVVLFERESATRPARRRVAAGRETGIRPLVDEAGTRRGEP